MGFRTLLMTKLILRGWLGKGTSSSILKRSDSLSRCRFKLTKRWWITPRTLLLWRGLPNISPKPKSQLKTLQWEKEFLNKVILSWKWGERQWWRACMEIEYILSYRQSNTGMRHQRRTKFYHRKISPSGIYRTIEIK